MGSSSLGSLTQKLGSSAFICSLLPFSCKDFLLFEILIGMPLLNTWFCHF